MQDRYDWFFSITKTAVAVFIATLIVVLLLYIAYLVVGEGNLTASKVGAAAPIAIAVFSVAGILSVVGAALFVRSRRV